MVKKLFYLLTAIIFLFAFIITTTPVFAQEEEQEEKPVEDIEEFSLEELLNVEITTAGKQAEKISEIPASVVLVTREDIEKYGYQSLADILRNIPGLYFTDDYFMENFGVRGFWSVTPQRNVIVLVNDVEQTEYTDNQNLLEQNRIPVEAIDRIEVVRGPMSVLYGAGAFFGVINIKTNQFDEKNPASQVGVSVGSEKAVKLFARAAAISGDFQYAFNGSYFQTDGPDIDMSKIGGASLSGLTTKGLLEKKEKYFNFSGSFKGFLFGASYSDADKETIVLLPPVADGFGNKFKAFRLYFGYEKKFSEKFRANARIIYFQTAWDFDYDFLIPNLYGVQTNWTNGYKAEMNLYINPTPKLNLTLGVNYTNVFDVGLKYAAPLFYGANFFYINLDDGESIINQSVFTQLNWKLSDRFKIVIGARVDQVPEYTFVKKTADFTTGVYSETRDQYSYTKAEFIPRVAIIWGLNDKNYIKFLYGKAINRPSFFQNTAIIGLPSGIPVLENERIETFEFNYIGTLSSKFSVGLSLFHNSLDKLIFRTLSYIGGVLTSYFANVGEMTTNGAEMTINLMPTNKFFVELSGTYQDTKDKRTGFEDIKVGYAPKFLGYIKASLFLNKDISVAVTGNYVSEMESYYDETISARLGGKVDGYFLLGANLRVRNLLGTGLFLNINGSNLLDKEIHFPATSNNSLFASKGTIDRGLSFLVTLGYRFTPMPKP